MTKAVHPQATSPKIFFKLFFSQADIEGPFLKKKVKILLEAASVPSNKNFKYHAIAIHLHPKRFTLEQEHRTKSKPDQAFTPYAGPYDIAVVKLNEPVSFYHNRVSSTDPKCNLIQELRNYLSLKVMPICLFDVDYRNFTFGYVAGFGSTNFGANCWTTKEGPNAFEQCKPEYKVQGKTYVVRDGSFMLTKSHISTTESHSRMNVSRTKCHQSRVSNVRDCLII